MDNRISSQIVAEILQGEFFIKQALSQHHALVKRNNEEKALIVLLKHNSIREAAKACGLSEITPYRYLGLEWINFKVKAVWVGYKVSSDDMGVASPRPGLRCMIVSILPQHGKFVVSVLR